MLLLLLLRRLIMTVGVGLHSATHTTHAFPPRLETIHPPTSALPPADSALPTLSLPVHPILPDVVVVVALVISRTSAVPEVRGSIRRQSVESYDLIIEVLRNSYIRSFPTSTRNSSKYRVKVKKTGTKCTAWWAIKDVLLLFLH